MVDLGRNRLDESTSPYLLQHRDNPVHWQPWSAETLAAAKTAERPILLSVGYAACHWCHVMAHESFEDPAIAAVMNELFVCIKVDREERPDVDTVYMHALQQLGGHGGWPLTMFLTPDGEPFWGGTYFPPVARHGMPGFAEVLKGLGHAWYSRSPAVGKNVEALSGALARLAHATAGDTISPALLDSIAERIERLIDRADGGIRGAPKFPQATMLELLWRAWKRTRRGSLREAVTVTLDHIAQGGIYDHLGGGFARYSVDARWLVPHFEKMLYDNAQLIELMTEIWQETRSPLYAARIAETIGWLAREMVLPDGGFASSLDADSEHEEGKFYVWTEPEIRAVLGARADLFNQFYDVIPTGNWEEHKNIPNRLRRPDFADAETEAELARCRSDLLAARAARVRPGLDDKVLADWNGLMIAALAKAGHVFDRPDWIELGRRCYHFVRGQMMAPDGRLRHAWREGKAQHHAVLDDYADMARAASALHQATGDSGCLQQAVDWVERVDAHYSDVTAGGYFLTADDAERLIARVKTAQDSPLPSGNGTMARALGELYLLTGEDRYRDRADRVVRAFSGDISREAWGFSTLLNAAELLARGVQIVIVGERDADDTKKLLGAVHRVSTPDRVITVLTPGTSIPLPHPAFGKGAVAGQATAYICRGRECSLPMTEPERVIEALSAAG